MDIGGISTIFSEVQQLLHSCTLWGVSREHRSRLNDLLQTALHHLGKGHHGFSPWIASVSWDAANVALPLARQLGRSDLADKLARVMSYASSRAMNS